MEGLRGGGDAIEAQPLERLGCPICGDGPCNPLNKLLVVSLHHVCVAVCLLVVGHHLHRHLVTQSCGGVFIPILLPSHSRVPPIALICRIVQQVSTILLSS